MIELLLGICIGWVARRYKQHNDEMRETIVAALEQYRKTLLTMPPDFYR